MKQYDEKQYKRDMSVIKRILLGGLAVCAFGVFHIAYTHPMFDLFWWL